VYNPVYISFPTRVRRDPSSSITPHLAVFYKTALFIFIFRCYTDKEVSALRIRCHAKLNWTLDILGRLPSGRHEMDMLMQSISLCDVLDLQPADDLTLSFDTPWDEPAEENLVYRAARLLQLHTGTSFGAYIRLSKSIPVQAGLGGGSADAAAALVGLNALWDLQLRTQTLLELGAQRGADIPFSIVGGTARATGTGTTLCPVPNRLPPLFLVVGMPCKGLSTGEVFRTYHICPPSPSPQNDAAQQALKEGNLTRFCASLGNALTGAACHLRPEISDALRKLMQHGAIAAQMSGSGSAVFGIFTDQTAAEDAVTKLPFPCYAAHPVTQGCLLTD